MNHKGQQGRRRKAGLTCGQMLLIFLLVVIIASAAAVAFGYALGLFDRLPFLATPAVSTTPVPDHPDAGVLPAQTKALSQPELPTSTAEATSTDATTPVSPTRAVVPTATPTFTPAATAPANVCAQLDLRYIDATSNVVSWRVANPSGQPFMLRQVEIAWPITNDAIFNVFVDGKVIWSGEDLDSPTLITNWIGEPGERTIQGSSRLEIIFGTAAASTGYELTLWFENGCAASHTR